MEDFESEHARGILDNAPVKVLTRTSDVDRVAPLLNLDDQYRHLWKSLSQRPGVYNEVLVVLDLLEGREDGVVVVREIPEDYLIATTTAAERHPRDRLAAAMGAWPAIQKLAARARHARGRKDYDAVRVGWPRIARPGCLPRACPGRRFSSAGRENPWSRPPLFPSRGSPRSPRRGHAGPSGRR